MKIGFIGYGNHAKRLHNCINSKFQYRELIQYHPTKKSNKITNDINKLYSSDIIFITSPNQTHAGYLKKILNECNAKIFCEKPPCTNLSDLKYLKSLSEEDKTRIYFNFNYRYSKLSNTIKIMLERGILGKKVFINALITHGLAFKPEYKDSWRAFYPKQKSVVLDTSLVHIIDLVNYHSSEKLTVNSCKHSSFKHGLDSTSVNLVSKSGLHVSLSASYAAPYSFLFQIIGTNGILNATESSLIVRNPRDTFNDVGYFITPPEIFSEKYSFENDYAYSLKQSVEKSLSFLFNDKTLIKKHFQKSIETNDLTLNCEKFGTLKET